MQTANDPFSSMLIGLFRPLVRLLLRLGVPFKSTAEALKWVYVDVATKEFSLDNKQSKSRVAVITGLTRLEVERLQRETPIATDMSVRMFNRAGRVINGWRYDARYQNASGQPLALPFDGDVSFQTLVNDFSGGTTPRAVLDELLRGNNVELGSDALYRLKSVDLLVTNKDQDEQLAILATAASDLISTIEYNLREVQTSRYLQAYAQQRDVPVSAIPEVRALVRKAGNQFLDDIDVALAKLKAQHASPDGSTEHCTRLGLGLYYFQEEPLAAPVTLDTRGRRSKRQNQTSLASELV